MDGRGIPHLPKPGRYGAPVIRYGPGREKLRLAHLQGILFERKVHRRSLGFDGMTKVLGAGIVAPSKPHGTLHGVPGQAGQAKYGLNGAPKAFVAVSFLS